MKIRKCYLEQIIKEELQKTLSEAPQGDSAQFQAIKVTMLDKIKDPETKKVFEVLIDLLSGNLKP